MKVRCITTKLTAHISHFSQTLQHFLNLLALHHLFPKKWLHEWDKFIWANLLKYSTTNLVIYACLMLLRLYQTRVEKWTPVWGHIVTKRVLSCFVYVIGFRVLSLLVQMLSAEIKINFFVTSLNMSNFHYIQPVWTQNRIFHVSCVFLPSSIILYW